MPYELPTLDTTPAAAVIRSWRHHSDFHHSMRALRRIPSSFTRAFLIARGDRRRCFAAHPDRLLLVFTSGRDCHRRRSDPIRPRTIAPPPCDASVLCRQSLPHQLPPSATTPVIAIRAHGWTPTPLTHGEPRVRSAPGGHS
ncbi:hypothetical protein B0H13DRAFT_2341992 [Mycena leptocephala]|nr:hypothetical protein B0H13DRAFT_2341992 [Mycena leptocephala]